MSWNTTKTNDGRNFQCTKFSVIDLVLTDRRNLWGTRPKSACDKSSSCRFLFSAAWNAINKATEYVTIGFLSVFWFSFYSRKVWTSLSVSSHNPNTSRQKTLDWEWWRLCCSFINLTEWRERRVTCQQLIDNIKHTWKDTIFFQVCY